MRFINPVPFMVSMLLAVTPAATAAAAGPISLHGDWAFQLDPANVGLQQEWQNAAFTETVRLPGSLDENGVGTPNSKAHRSYLSRLVEYVGAAWYQREIDIPEAWAGQPLELFLERCHWETQLWIDGRLAGMRDSLCAPHVYTLDPLAPGSHRIALRVDNNIKYEVGPNAHSITEHTQTNWNGIIGRMELGPLPAVRFADVQVYPSAAGRTAVIRASIANTLAKDARVTVAAAALGVNATVQASIPADGEGAVELQLQFDSTAPLWDEFDPRLIDATLSLRTHGHDTADARQVRFGLRDFGFAGTQFTLNGRPYFVRGTLECCIFPYTAHPPMDKGAWHHMMETARQYGLNHFRFHSWCPPEAAFEAADEAGITFQIETPVWTDLGKHPDLDRYIYSEGDRILAAYGNHPSFTMLCVGNEPSGPNKDAFLTDIVQYWQAKDARRLYTTCSGWPELPVSDFHVVHARNGKPYRLHAGPLGPNTTVDYRDVLEGCGKPAIAHELGQWCVYPDYREIPNYTGVLRARNLEGFRQGLIQSGMLDQARAFAWASGRLQFLLYKADMEALLRTPGAGGFQLLALQDFPGQGSALEGFVDAFWNSKGAVTPDEFRRCCSETVPLLRLEKFAWTDRETLNAKAEIAHFGAAPVTHAHPCWTATLTDGAVLAHGEWPEREIPIGNAIELGDISFSLNDFKRPGKVTLSVFLAGTRAFNSWDIWVYPAFKGDGDSGPVLVADEWNDTVAAALRRGRSVLFLPAQIAATRRVKSAFEPIFWNTQWFPGQDRQLGILCDPQHPAFAQFPNDGHTDWQWYELLHRSTVMRLDGIAPQFRPLVQVIDDWNKNRLLGAVFEGRVGKGRLLVCTLDIQRDREHRPAAAALRRSLLDYMLSPAFAPKTDIAPAWLEDAFKVSEMAVAEVQADASAPGYAPENAVDGNADTIWHTPWDGNPPAFPHELRIRYHRDITVSGLRCLPRQDVANGYIGRYEIYAARDGRNWGAPIAMGEMKPAKEPQEIRFDTPVKTRWLRLVALTSAGNDPFAAIAEISPIMQQK